jgi:signal transduction histidine kinase
MLTPILSFLRQPWSTAENRRVLLVQMVVMLGASLLFTASYEIQRQIRVIMERDGTEVLISGWDGLAWLVWPLAGPAILVLIRRFPLVRGEIVWGVCRLAISSFLLFGAVINARFVLRGVPHGLTVDWHHYLRTTLELLPVDFLTYCGFFFATFGIDYYFKHRRRQDEALQLQARAAHLESDVARAELAALRAQLHPHFLFNSFNAVATLIRQRRSEAAIEMIEQISQLLRLAMERTQQTEVVLADELEFVRRYTAIEQIRFGAKLAVTFDIEPETSEALIPNFLLQPLVENAIKHGISRRATPGAVYLGAHRAEGRLSLVIENDGPDAASAELIPQPPGAGVGLANTRARLEKIYGADYHFQLINRPDGGMRISLNLPWRVVSPLPLEKNTRTDRG